MSRSATAAVLRSPCDPKTLARAARDYAAERPEFALGAGLLAFHWLVQGYGYEVDAVDVRDAYRFTLAAAEKCGTAEDARARVHEMIATTEKIAVGRFVAAALALQISTPPA